LPARISDLLELAQKGLRRMQLEEGSFCLDFVQGDPAPKGRSFRYTVMTYLGLLRADQAGLAHGFDLGRIAASLRAEVSSPELHAGDLGLYLWAAARGGLDGADEVLARLEGTDLAALEGQELAWIVLGTAHRQAPSAGPAVEQLLSRQAASGLLRHGSEGWRSRFPNFATQSYGILALATAAQLDVGERAGPAARKIADRLLELQLPDGGWPWLYDTERGRVVERYEVYSVHQHAMAPMALLELGGDRYVEAARHGLAWIHGRNELGVDMVDKAEGIILRSIRRRRPLDRLALYGRTAAAFAGVVRDRPGRLLELNRTCRPYELGWVLEAWSGRESLASPG
jgi:hypothetical protein